MKDLTLKPSTRKPNINKAYPKSCQPHLHIHEDSQPKIYYFKRNGKRLNVANHRLKGVEVDIWKSLTGNLNSNEIFEKISKGFDKKGVLKNIFLKTLRKWNSKQVQLIELLDAPFSSLNSKVRNESKLMHIAANIFREKKALLETKNIYDSYNYHKHAIKEPDKQFEKEEKTFSHLLREKTIVLGNISYGERFIKAILARKRFFNGIKIAEIGGGLGYLAFNAIRNMKKRFKKSSFSYILLDLSAKLLNAQQKLNKRFYSCLNFVQANAIRLPFQSNSLDIIIANECIADFPVAKFTNFIFPLGIVSFLEEIRRILRKNGLAVLVEYGSFDYRTRIVRLEGHLEYSIDFSIIKSISQRIGFKVEVLDLSNFLKIRDIPLLSLTSKILLKKFLSSKGKKNKKELYTKKLLKKELGSLLARVKNLQFVSARRNIDGFDPTEFKVLILYN
ncbi:MAG: class I SAM-dependent methyltransferase [Candidatus Omnitrophota bacterium]